MSPLIEPRLSRERVGEGKSHGLEIRADSRGKKRPECGPDGRRLAGRPSKILNDVIRNKKVGRAFADSRPAFCSRERGRTFPRLSLQRTCNDGRLIFYSGIYGSERYGFHDPYN